MDHFLKKFTIIDFLSMFIPGGIMVLAWNYYVGGVLEPFYQFFGQQDVILTGYFIAISYLTGMVLQILYSFDSTSACNNNIIIPIVSVIVAYLMYHRSKRFYKLTYERAYRDFLKCGNS